MNNINLLKSSEQLLTALKNQPWQDGLWNELGGVLIKLNQVSEALKCYKKALEINPNQIQSYLALGQIAANGERSTEAVDYFTKALAIDADNHVANYELSRIYYIQTGEFSKAAYHAKKALDLKPDCDEAKVTLAELLLLQGNLIEGFPMFDQSRHLYIDKNSGRYKFFQKIPRWQGEIFSGKRLIIGEDGGFGGFGDILWLARYLPLVKERGGICVLPVKKELFRLFKSLAGVDEFLLPSIDPIYPEDFDLHIPFISLPTVFSTTLNTIPANIPYLFPEKDLILHWQKLIETAARYSESTLKVGLVWSSGLISTEKNRICSFKALLPLGGIENIAYYNLQIGEPSKEYLSADCNLNITDLTGHIKDFADTAALITNLDLVISVDTATAHLTGAIGKPVWLLLPFRCEWRWLLDRSESPWYPTMRIFRSKTEGDWVDPVNEICANLKAAIKDKSLL